MTTRTAQTTPIADLIALPQHGQTGNVALTSAASFEI